MPALVAKLYVIGEEKEAEGVADVLTMIFSPPRNLARSIQWHQNAILIKKTCVSYRYGKMNSCQDLATTQPRS